MAITGISANPAAGIDNVLAQLRMAQARTQQGVAPGAAQATQGAAASGLRGTLRLSADDSGQVGGSGATTGGGFAAVLRTSLDQVSAAQNTATQLGQKFEKGEGNVDLNDVMVAMQKANVGFQAAVQVRNRMVSAYHDLMNMQI